jgi:transposase-like protein
MAAPRKYPDELRERAIREVRTTGRPIAHVAKDLGIQRAEQRLMWWDWFSRSITCSTAWW